MMMQRYCEVPALSPLAVSLCLVLVVDPDNAEILED